MVCVILKSTIPAAPSRLLRRGMALVLMISALAHQNGFVKAGVMTSSARPDALAFSCASSLGFTGPALRVPAPVQGLQVRRFSRREPSETR
jgi:hypothetical protein